MHIDGRKCTLSARISFLGPSLECASETASFYDYYDYFPIAALEVDRGARLILELREILRLIKLFAICAHTFNTLRFARISFYVRVTCSCSFVVVDMI